MSSSESPALPLKKTGDDQLEEFLSQPFLSFLQPVPWSETAKILKLGLGALALGFLLAVLAHRNGIHALKRPAKYSWFAGTLLFVFAAAIGLPTMPKFVILCLFVLIAIPVMFFCGLSYVMTGQFVNPSTPAGGSNATAGDDIELADALGEADRLIAEENREKGSAT